MTFVELLRSPLERLHMSLEEAVKDLTTEQLHWRPSEGCNHIAFSLWHYVRTEDNLIRFVLQNPQADGVAGTGLGRAVRS